MAPEQAKLDLVRQWLHKAEQDFSLAAHLLSEGRYPEAVAFHSQQAAEKLLKGILVLHQIEFPKTHNLGELLDRLALAEPSRAAALRDVTGLNPYGVEHRYPGDFPELTQEEARTAFQLAEKLRATVMPLLTAAIESA